MCKKCNHEFVVMHGMTENPKIKCELCHKGCIRLITGGSGTIFKGDGWAKDGYTKAATPLDNKDANPGTCVRIPEYADRNTGKKLGYGTPEFTNP